MAETFAMIKGTEAGCRIRAAIVDMKGLLDFPQLGGVSFQGYGSCLDDRLRQLV